MVVILKHRDMTPRPSENNAQDTKEDGNRLRRNKKKGTLPCSCFSVPFTASMKDLPFQAFALYLAEPNVF